MPTGDRPIFPLLKQRLDKVDVEAITDLVQETVLRTIGSILGPCEGFLSEVTATYSAPFLTLGACRLAYVSYVSDSDVVMDGGVVSFRPELDPSGGQIDLSPLGGNPGYLFFRRLETDMDEENRAYFDVISQTKRVGATNTRMREIVEFQPAEDLTTYTSAAGWGLCGRIQWGGSVAYFEPIAAGEIRNTAGVPQNVLRGYGDSGLGVLWRAGGGPAAQTPVGVIRYLQQIVGMVQHILDKDFTLNELGQQLTPADRQFRWTSYSLARDVNELHTDLAAAETTLSGLASVPSDVDLLQQQIVVPVVAPCIFTAVRTVGPSSFTFKDAKSLLLSHAAGGTGEYILSFDTSGMTLGDPGPFIYQGGVSVLLTVMGTAARRDTIATYQWTGAGTLTVWTYEQDNVSGTTFSPVDAEFSIAIFPVV